MAIAFDPFSSEWRDDPYPVYRRLRDLAPVHLCPERRLVSVTRFDDVMEVLRRPEVFSSRAMFTQLLAGGDESPPLSLGFLRFIAKMFWRTRLNPLEFSTARMLIAEDGESHAQLRTIVSRGFTPRRIAAWEGRIREVTEARIAALRRGEDFELVRDLAVPLPTTIIAEMLGVPADRLPDFKRWSDLIIEFATGPGREDRFARRFTDGLCDMMAFMLHLARDRRRDPADDLLSVIVAEQEGAAGLSDREVVMFVILLLVAGNETTTNLIGNVVNALLDHPAVAEAVAADPGLVPALVEEGLRYDTPVQVVFRNTTGEIELAGHRLGADTTLAVFLGSALRDERRFERPDELDLGREPRGTPAFGFGKHFCLGASLARLEARVALEALAPHLPHLRRVESRVARIDSFLVRGPARLPLRRAA